MSLGINLLNLHQLFEARRLIDRAWKGMRDKLGAEHPYTKRVTEARNRVTEAMGGRTRPAKRGRR
jgi:hypothetical protein